MADERVKFCGRHRKFWIAEAANRDHDDRTASECPEHRGTTGRTEAIAHVGAIRRSDAVVLESVAGLGVPTSETIAS